MTDVIDTTWAKLPEEVSKHLAELGLAEKNRRVRMEIVHLKEADVVTVTEGEVAPVEKERDEWLRRFKAFVEGGPRVDHIVDDSRDTIYAEGRS